MRCAPIHASHGDSILHRLPPHVKIVSAVAFVFAIVATPREAVWAFAGYLAALAILAWQGQLQARFVVLRLGIEIPFVVAAFLLPFFSGGETIDLLGIAVSREGLWDMWNIVAKATLGLLTSIILTGITPVSEMLRGFQNLRTPRLITSIMIFMIRYVDILLAELHRTHIAMQSRGYRARWLGHITHYARLFGHLFVRSYERGERVYLAMESRNFRDSIPTIAGDRASTTQWLAVLTVPAIAWTVAATSLLMV